MEVVNLIKVTLTNEILKRISEIDILSDHGIIICERPAEKQLDLAIPGLQRGKDYRYGKTWITLFRKANAPI